MNPEPTQALAVQAASPMHMLQTALEKGLDPATLKELMDLRDRWEASEAKKAYMEAVAAFKANPPKVIKDRLNKQYGSKYSSLANLVNTVNVGLSACGLNARWNIHQAEGLVTVTCILSHVGGHSESVPLTGGLDTSGAKNNLQQLKSTITYLKIATYEAVTGIASEDEGDDDGNGAGTATISREQEAELRKMIDDLGADAAERSEVLAQFLAFRQVKNLDEIAAQAFGDCKRALEAKNKAKKKSTEKAHG